LKANSNKSYYQGRYASQCQYPPANADAESEVKQPFIHGIPGYRHGYHGRNFTSFRKSRDNSVTICGTVAPNTLRKPISLTRWPIVNAESPSNPRHAIKIAIHENIVN